MVHTAREQTQMKPHGRRKSGRKPRSQYIRERLLKGRTDYDKIAAECQRKYPELETERKHVLHYRWHLRKAGYDV